MTLLEDNPTTITPASPEVISILEGAIKRIEAGWCKGQLRKVGTLFGLAADEEQVCTMGALFFSAGGETGPLFEEAKGFVEEAAGVRHGSLPMWNDRSEKEDVVAAFGLALDRARGLA